MVRQSGQTDESKKRGRSPEYPGFNLQQAVELAEVLHNREGQNAAPINAVLKHWNYPPKSGPGSRAIAALERFGLITTEGSGDNRKARISVDAFNLLIDERPNSEDRVRLLQRAALKPTAHLELWQAYGADLPSDETIKFELRKRHYTEGGATYFLDKYKSTLAFAKLDKIDTLSDSKDDKYGDDTDANQSSRSQISQRNRPLRQGMTVLSLQVSDRLVEIGVEGGPLTKGELSILRRYLELQEEVTPSQRELPEVKSTTVA